MAYWNLNTWHKNLFINLHLEFRPTQYMNNNYYQSSSKLCPRLKKFPYNAFTDHINRHKRCLSHASRKLAYNRFDLHHADDKKDAYCVLIYREGIAETRLFPPKHIERRLNCHTWTHARPTTAYSTINLQYDLIHVLLVFAIRCLSQMAQELTIMRDLSHVKYITQSGLLMYTTRNTHQVTVC